MKDPKKVKELILKSVDLAEVMLQYRVWFTFDPRRASQVQYRCPFHGKDNKPSARFYRDAESEDGRRAHCYCWFCKKSWDVISFIMEKENFAYLEALRYILGRYKVDTSVIPDEPEIKLEEPHKTSEPSVAMISAENAVRGLRGKADLEKYKILCSALIGARFSAANGSDVTETAKKILSKAQKIQEVVNA